MAKKKDNPSATDLLENPLISGYEDDPGTDTPFDKAFNVLTATGGARLELMTRTTKKLADAVNVGYNMMYNFKSMYIRGKLDTLMRIHVSMGGKGRAEMVQSLQAGSGVPGEYYDAGNMSKNAFLDIGTEDNPDD